MGWRKISHVGNCEGCRSYNIGLTRHHLIPRSTEDKAARIARHQAGLTSPRSNTRISVWLCEGCHDHVHAQFTNEQLRKMSRDQQLAALAHRQKMYR